MQTSPSPEQQRRNMNSNWRQRASTDICTSDRSASTITTSTTEQTTENMTAEEQQLPQSSTPTLTIESNVGSIFIEPNTNLESKQQQANNPIPKETTSTQEEEARNFEYTK